MSCTGSDTCDEKTVTNVPLFEAEALWEPGPKCRQSRRHCVDTAFAKGERCTWCGLGEDGSYD